MTSMEGGVTKPVGFKASGVHAGLKKNPENLDCALVMSEQICTVAGTFTKNVMKAAPVLWNMDVCERGKSWGVFINSGNANAATGKQGLSDVKDMAGFVASCGPIYPNDICICSTGVIGVLLPMDKIENGIDDCIDRLSEPGHSYAAKAIMTTDTVPKERAIDYEMGGRTVTLGGMAKGSGMISPNMATMISVITTDADIPHELLKPLTKEIVEISFNQIGVDNDMSTSDTVLVFANGMSGTPEIQVDSPEYEQFKEALTTICQELAKDIVKDGEGATKFVEISVTGAETDEDAKTITRAIGNSMLCKTAFFGQDPNWGRFACAAGYSGVQFNPEELSIALDSIVLCQNGQVAQYKEKDAAAIMLQPEFTIHISVGKGSGQAVFWTSDLSHDYVSINADYRS